MAREVTQTLFIQWASVDGHDGMSLWLKIVAKRLPTFIMITGFLNCHTL